MVRLIILRDPNRIPYPVLFPRLNQRPSEKQSAQNVPVHNGGLSWMSDVRAAVSVSTLSHEVEERTPGKPWLGWRASWLGAHYTTPYTTKATAVYLLPMRSIIMMRPRG